MHGRVVDAASGEAVAEGDPRESPEYICRTCYHARANHAGSIEDFLPPPSPGRRPRALPGSHRPRRTRPRRPARRCARRPPRSTPAGKVPLIKRSWRPRISRRRPVTSTRSSRRTMRSSCATPGETSRRDAAAWRLSVGGDAAERSRVHPGTVEREFDSVEIAAFACAPATAAACPIACSRRAMGPWRHGQCEMEGRAAEDVLAKGGCEGGRARSRVRRADGGVIEKTPDFTKSIPVLEGPRREHADRWEMNGEPLRTGTDFRHGVVVPGWTATY